MFVLIEQKEFFKEESRKLFSISLANLTNQIASFQFLFRTPFQIIPVNISLPPPGIPPSP